MEGNNKRNKILDPALREIQIEIENLIDGNLSMQILKGDPVFHVVKQLDAKSMFMLAEASVSIRLYFSNKNMWRQYVDFNIAAKETYLEVLRIALFEDIDYKKFLFAYTMRFETNVNFYEMQANDYIKSLTVLFTMHWDKTNEVKRNILQIFGPGSSQHAPYINRRLNMYLNATNQDLVEMNKRGMITIPNPNDEIRCLVLYSVLSRPNIYMDIFSGEREKYGNSRFLREEINSFYI